MKSVDQYRYIMRAMEFLVGARSASAGATERLSFRTLRGQVTHDNRWTNTLTLGPQKLPVDVSMSRQDYHRLLYKHFHEEDAAAGGSLGSTARQCPTAPFRTMLQHVPRHHHDPRVDGRVDPRRALKPPIDNDAQLAANIVLGHAKQLLLSFFAEGEPHGRRTVVLCDHYRGDHVLLGQQNLVAGVVRPLSAPHDHGHLGQMVRRGTLDDSDFQGYIRIVRATPDAQHARNQRGNDTGGSSPGVVSHDNLLAKLGSALNIEWVWWFCHSPDEIGSS